MGFIGSVLTENGNLTIWDFLIGIIWRSLVFWVPFIGKLIALGHLWFLWNLFQYSLFLIPIFSIVRNNPDGKMIIAPAMNGKMWSHPATQANVALLRERGVQFIGPAEGDLACGYEGFGRLEPAESIVEAALQSVGLSS